MHTEGDLGPGLYTSPTITGHLWAERYILPLMHALKMKSKYTGQYTTFMTYYLFYLEQGAVRYDIFELEQCADSCRPFCLFDLTLVWHITGDLIRPTMKENVSQNSS